MVSETREKNVARRFVPSAMTTEKVSHHTFRSDLTEAGHYQTELNERK